MLFSPANIERLKALEKSYNWYFQVVIPGQQTTDPKLTRSFQTAKGTRIIEVVW